MHLLFFSSGTGNRWDPETTQVHQDGLLSFPVPLLSSLITDLYPVFSIFWTLIKDLKLNGRFPLQLRPRSDAKTRKIGPNCRSRLHKWKSLWTQALATSDAYASSGSETLETRQLVKNLFLLKRTWVLYHLPNFRILKILYKRFDLIRMLAPKTVVNSRSFVFKDRLWIKSENYLQIHKALINSLWDNQSILLRVDSFIQGNELQKVSCQCHKIERNKSKSPSVFSLCRL